MNQWRDNKQEEGSRGNRGGQGLLGDVKGRRARTGGEGRQQPQAESKRKEADAASRRQSSKPKQNVVSDQKKSIAHQNFKMEVGQAQKVQTGTWTGGAATISNQGMQNQPRGQSGSHMNMGPPEQNDGIERKQRHAQPEDPWAPDRGDQIQMLPANSMLRDVVDRDRLRDSQQAIRESQIGLLVDKTLEKHNSWYEEEGKRINGTGEPDGLDLEDIRMILTRSVEKQEFNNVLDISSIRLADSEQQQKFGASVGQQASPQVRGFEPNQFASNNNMLPNHNQASATRKTGGNLRSGNDQAGPQHLHTQPDKFSKAGSALARTHKQFFNKTMKVSEINKMSNQEAADGISSQNQQQNKYLMEGSMHQSTQDGFLKFAPDCSSRLRTAEKGNILHDGHGIELFSGSELKALGAHPLQLSSAHSQKFTDELNELSSALNQGCFIDKEKTNGTAAGDVYNLLNISKDDEESIINLLKDYVTLKLGNGKEIQIPKLNLAVLSSNLPDHIQFEISQQMINNNNQSNNVLMQNQQPNMQISSAISNITGEQQQMLQTMSVGQDAFQAELNGLAVGGSRLNQQAFGDAHNLQKQNLRFTSEFNEILNKSSIVQATSASALQQLQSQANKSSFNNTTTQEEAQIAVVNQTTNNAKSTQLEPGNNRMLTGTALSNQEANAPGAGIAMAGGSGAPDTRLAHAQSRDNVIGIQELGQGTAEDRKARKVADVARRTVNELSEFADLINNLNATENENTQHNTLSLNEGPLNMQEGLGGADSFNFGGQADKRWLDTDFVQGLQARPSTTDEKIDESQLINMIRIDDEEEDEAYSGEQGAVFIQEQDHGGPSLSSRRSSASQVVNELDRQFSHIDITNSGASSAEKAGGTPGAPGQDLNTAIYDASAQRITSGLISKPVDIFDHGDVFMGPENFFNGESPITCSNVAKMNQQSFANQLLIDQHGKPNNLFANEMFEQASNQFERKLSSVSSFKPADTASQRSSKPIGKLFLGNAGNGTSLNGAVKYKSRQGNGQVSQIVKHSLVSNQRPVNVGGDQRADNLMAGDGKMDNFLVTSMENYDFKTQQMMFDLQVENDIRNDSFQKEQNNRWQRRRRQGLDDFCDNRSDTLNLNERTAEIEEGHQGNVDWQAHEEEQFDLYEGPSGLFDRQGFPEDDQLHRDFLDLCEQERVNSFENTYNQELARDLTYIDAHGGFDFTSHQNQSLQLGPDNTMLQQHPPRHFFDQINNSVMLKDHSSRKNRMTILDRKNNVRHRLIGRQTSNGKQMLDMTHPGIVFAGSSKNDHNNLSASLGDQWWDVYDDQLSIGKYDEDERANQAGKDQQKRKATTVGKKQKPVGVAGQRVGLVGRGTVKANSRINCRSRRWVDVNGANEVFHAGAGNFTPMASNNRNRGQAVAGAHDHKANNNLILAKRNNFMDEVKSNLSNISMLNENNPSVKGGAAAGGERVSLKSRSFNQQSLKAKQSSKSRYAAQKVLMDRSQNIGDMLRGRPNNTLLAKNTIQQPICSPTEPSFIRFQSQRSCNSLSKAGAASGHAGGARTRHKSSLAKPTHTTRKTAQHDCYLNSPISKKLKKKSTQAAANPQGARHNSGDNKKPRLLQSNHRNQYYQQYQQQNQVVNQGRSATAGVKETCGSTMAGAAAVNAAALKGTSLMLKGINMRCKSGKTSDGGGGANVSRLNTSTNAGGGGYGTRKQVMSLSRRGVPTGGAQTSFNHGQPSTNAKHQYQSHRSQKSRKSSNHNGTKSKNGGAGRQQKPDLDSSTKSIKQSERHYRNAGARSRANTTAENASARHGPYQLSKVNYNSSQNKQTSGPKQEKYQRGRSRSKENRSDQEERQSNERRHAHRDFDSNRRGAPLGNAAYDNVDYQGNSNRKSNETYSMDKLRQAVSTHGGNSDAQPTIIQFNNVKDAVISVGISSNGRIIDPNQNTNVYQAASAENGTSGQRSAIIIARRDQQQMRPAPPPRDPGATNQQPEDGYGIHDGSRAAANDHSRRPFFQSFGISEVKPDEQVDGETLARNIIGTQHGSGQIQQNSVCDAFLKESYINEKQNLAYDGGVYRDAAPGNERRPYENMRRKDNQQESRGSRDSSFRKEDNAPGGQGGKNLAQSYGAKLPLKIQLKPNSTNSSRQSKHSTNTAAARQNLKMSGGGAAARGDKSGGLRQPINEMVIQQNYNCSPKPRSVVANASIDPNKLNYGPMSEANGETQPRPSQRGKNALSYGKAPKSQQARPECQTEADQQQPLISAKKVIAKSVRSSQNKKINLGPTSNRDSERGGKPGQLDGNDCDDARAKFLLNAAGPLSIQHQAQLHRKRSQEGVGGQDDADDYHEQQLDGLNGLGSCKSGGAQIAYNSTDSKANKKRIDIKNLINQSKIKRLQTNLKQQKQAPQQPPGDPNSRVRKSEDFANDFKSEDHAVSSNSNNVFGRFSGVNKDVTSLGSQGVNAQLYGQANERFSNQTTTCNQQSQIKGTFAQSTTQREQELILLQTKLEVAELERDQALQRCNALDKLCRSQQKRIAEMEELLLLSKGSTDQTIPSQQLSTDVNYLTVPTTQEARSNMREPNPANIVGQLTQSNAELQQENRKLLESLQVLVAKLASPSELNKDSSLSDKSKQIPDGQAVYDQDAQNMAVFQLINDLFRGSNSSGSNQLAGVHRNLAVQPTSSTGLNSRRSNTLEKGGQASSNNESNSKTISHNYYFPTAKSTNSIKPSSVAESSKGAQTIVPTANVGGQPATGAGVQKHHIRLTNIQLNLAASKVLKKKNVAEYASNSHQNSTAIQASEKKDGQRQASSTHGSNPGSKTLLQPNKGSLILGNNLALEKSKIQLQQQASKRSGNIMKQNLIRVKQAQIDFQRHQQSTKQPLNIRLVPSGNGKTSAGERNSGGHSSKRFGQPLRIQKQQTTSNGPITSAGKLRNYSSDTQKKPKTEAHGDSEMEANFKSNLSRLSDANAKNTSERTNSMKNKKVTLQGNVLKKKSIKIKLASRDPSKESVDVTPADVQRLAIKDVVLNTNVFGSNGSILATSSSQKKSLLSGSQIQQKPSKPHHYSSQNWTGAGTAASQKQDYDMVNSGYLPHPHPQTETGSSTKIHHNEGKISSFPSNVETHHKISQGTHGGGDISVSESYTKESQGYLGQVSQAEMSGLTHSLLQSAAAKDQNFMKKVQVYNNNQKQPAQEPLMADSKLLQVDRLQNQVALSKDPAPSATSSTHRSQSQKALLLRQQLLQQQQTLLLERRSDRIGGRDAAALGQEAGHNEEHEDQEKMRGLGLPIDNINEASCGRVIERT